MVALPHVVINVLYKKCKSIFLIQSPISVAVERLSPSMLEWLASRDLGLEIDFFSLPENLHESRLPAHLSEYKAMLADFEGIRSIHAPFYEIYPVSREPLVEEVARKRCWQALDIAQELGAKHLVFHANYKPSQRPDFLAFWQGRQIAFWQKLSEELEKRGLYGYLENTQEETPAYLLPIVQQINSPNLRLCYDTGHSHCFTRAKIAPRYWVETYGDYLGYVHLHANHGQHDEHLCYTRGEIDFGGFFEALKALSQPPLLVIEVKTMACVEASYAALRQQNYR